MTTRILFVCMGNICRSPTAEAVFREIARTEFPGFSVEVDSAGTHDYHIGDRPDRRSIEAAQRRGYDLSPLRARQLVREDFERFHWLLAMDQRNHALMVDLAPATQRHRARLFLELAVHTARLEVPDPYYGGPEGFEDVLNLVEEGSRLLLDRLARGDDPVIASGSAAPDGGNRG